MKQLTPGDWGKASQLAGQLSHSWYVVQPSLAVRAKATQLVASHDLRAADALQLAAALEWCQNAPQGQVFLAADEKLREAAIQQGFDAKPM